MDDNMLKTFVYFKMIDNWPKGESRWWRRQAFFNGTGIGGVFCFELWLEDNGQLDVIRARDLCGDS